MSYTSRYLQFGNNDVRVPGYEEALILSNKPFAPIPIKLVDTLVNPAASHLWDLIFSYVSSDFYLPAAKVPGVDGTVIDSWYMEEGGGGGGHNVLAFRPFIVDESGSGVFGQATNYVDFTETPAADGSVNTDTIPHSSVTATVHPELPEYSKLSLATHATSHSIVLSNTTTQAAFNRIFVYRGSSIPVGHSLTVPKGQSCYALAVFKKTTTTSSSEISTIQYPKIPWWEWQIIVAEVVKQIVVTGQAEIYEFLSPSAIASLGREAARTAITDIGRRIESLVRIKSVISGLTENTRD